MTDKTSLGDRMKTYEQATRMVLPRHTQAIVRVDGRAFHSFLRHADKPFDDAIIAGMDAVAEALCAEMSGAVFAYTQSDECSVLLTDFATQNTQPWFGGVTQKIASVAASIATVAFNRVYGIGYDDAFATFDGRVFTVPNEVETANYFVWRQRDAVRNSISMTAQAHFSHKRLHGVTTAQMKDLLADEAGVVWEDLPAGCQRGRVTLRKTGEKEVSYVDKRTQQRVTTTAMRSWWETSGAPHFTAQPGAFLHDVIPAIPTLGPSREEV
ncbi:tRNA(His) guanylyltransferase Thg1 family protein [Actinomadura viridis]|uniref:tRNA(His) guanylyltransferase Thg1 family protein n=1 Tax=Actinomadura viridis TaxID=58110 RepID=UPI0036803469